MDDEESLAEAAWVLRERLYELDQTCAPQRITSELAQLNRSPGTTVAVSDVLIQATRAACDAARRTRGAVDPTAQFGGPAPGWRRVEVDERERTITLPPGVSLDLSLTSGAHVADRVVEHVTGAAGLPVFVSVGGDLAIGGLREGEVAVVEICSDPAWPAACGNEQLAMGTGGIAVCAPAHSWWWHGGRRVHPVVDPATGEPPPDHWLAVWARAASCAEAKAYATAGIIWGVDAPQRLERLGVSARLLRLDGEVLTTSPWSAARAARRVFGAAVSS